MPSDTSHFNLITMNFKTSGTFNMVHTVDTTKEKAKNWFEENTELSAGIGAGVALLLILLLCYCKCCRR